MGRENGSALMPEDLILALFFSVNLFKHKFL